MRDGLFSSCVTAVVCFFLMCTATANRAHAEGDDVKSYTLQAKTDPAAVTKDTPSNYTLTIEPNGGWVMKTETPFRVSLKGSAHVSLAQDAFVSKDFVDPKAAAKSVTTTFTCTTSGEHKISADVTFFLCSDEICQRYKDTAELTVIVK